MRDLWLHFGTVFAGFFAIMNPLANAPIFLGVTDGDDAKTRRAVAFRSLALAGGFLVAPVGNVEIPLPFSVDRTPRTVESRQILSRLLPNVYRAFEFPTESAAYDRLALSVTGDTLTEIYLEHRRAVTTEERGGARARVEAVEVLSVAGVEPGDREGFVTDATWTVGGTVTHFVTDGVRSYILTFSPSSPCGS